VTDAAAPSFEYAMSVLPPSRVGFRRWRWELWHGMVLIACGWRVSPRDAEHALHTAASRRAHELRGLRPLRPERARVIGRFASGGVVRVDCGAFSCVLAPRREPEPA
jgi:hypothetical protein